MAFTSIKHGAYGGLAGGAVFGAIICMMGMLPMFGRMMGLATVGAGFVTHVLISAMIGAGFAVNCAARSCPPIPGESYRGATLTQQLDRATRTFLALPGNGCLRHSLLEM